MDYIEKIKSGTEKKENEDIASWFIDVYYADRSVVWQNSSGVRKKGNSGTNPDNGLQ